MEEANLKPREDVDTVVIVGIMPSGGYGETPVLALFEGRFDPERLAAAAVTRGATRVSTAAGDYFLLPDKSPSSRHGKRRRRVRERAPRDRRDGVRGRRRPSRRGARAARASLSGAGLGAQLSRIDRGASVWALVDVTRYPQVQNGFSRGGNAQLRKRRGPGPLRRDEVGHVLLVPGDRPRRRPRPRRDGRDARTPRRGSCSRTP